MTLGVLVLICLFTNPSLRSFKEATPSEVDILYQFSDCWMNADLPIGYRKSYDFMVFSQWEMTYALGCSGTHGYLYVTDKYVGFLGNFFQLSQTAG